MLLVYRRTKSVNDRHRWVAVYPRLHLCLCTLLLPAGMIMLVPRLHRCRRTYFLTSIIDHHRIYLPAIIFIHLLLLLARFCHRPLERRIRGGKNHCRLHATLVSIHRDENEYEITKVCATHLQQATTTNWRAASFINGTQSHLRQTDFFTLLRFIIIYFPPFFPFCCACKDASGSLK